jgi:hypothetical protein
MKSKNQYPCPMCDCDKTRTLSDESAVEIHEFLEAISANFLSRYGQRIQRHYARLAARNINDQQPWRRSDEPF